MVLHPSLPLGPLLSEISSLVRFVREKVSVTDFTTSELLDLVKNYTSSRKPLATVLSMSRALARSR